MKKNQFGLPQRIAKSSQAGFEAAQPVWIWRDGTQFGARICPAAQPTAAKRVAGIDPGVGYRAVVAPRPRRFV